MTPPRLISTDYAITDHHRRTYQADGFIRLANVFDEPTLAFYEPEITQQILANNRFADVPLEQRSTYHRAFIQISQLWQKSDLVRTLTFSRRLARIAAELMGVRGVRLYHDQALYKERGGGITPWHADQQYWPLASEKCVTAWIPLHAVPVEMGALCFARGSHTRAIGRDLPISDDSERLIAEAVTDEHVEVVSEPFALGDVSFHAGWTLHRTGPNQTDTPRRVHTVIYMAADMRLSETMTETQEVDWQAFSPSTRPGEIMADALNPLLYEAS